MNRDTFIKNIVEDVDKEISQMGFSLQELDLKKERYVQFYMEENSMCFYFSMNFLHNDNIVERVSISNNEITTIVKKSKIWKPSHLHEQWMLGMENLAVLSNPENKDGYFNSNYYENISFDMAKLQHSKRQLKKHFEDNTRSNILKIIGKFKNLEKIDEMINSKPFAKGEVPLLFFSANIQKQLLVGMMISHLINRPDRQDLCKHYYEYINNFSADEYPVAKQFIKVYEFLNR